MTRAPSLDTLCAIGAAFDARDRRSNRPPAPVALPLQSPGLRGASSTNRRPPLSPMETAGSLRGLARDIDAILSHPADVTARELTLAALSAQLTALALQAEGAP